jgi:hypothetical protein
MDDEDLDLHDIDGDDPMAPVGPEYCAVDPAETTIKPGERDGPPHECDYPAKAELDDSFLAEELVTPIGEDGLPDHSADGAPKGTHPFTIETVCCIEDDRSYVELFEEEFLPRLHDDHPALGHGAGLVPFEIRIARANIRMRERFTNTGQEKDRRVFEPEEVERLWGELFGVPVSGDLVPVRPARERCKYYARQHFANDESPGQPDEFGHNIILRVCTHPARRSIGGAGMSLTNEAIYGCDLRDPHDAKSVEWLDRHDSNKIRNRPDRVRLPLFQLDGDEVVEQDEEPAFDGRDMASMAAAAEMLSDDQDNAAEVDGDDASSSAEAVGRGGSSTITSGCDACDEITRLMTAAAAGNRARIDRPPNAIERAIGAITVRVLSKPSSEPPWQGKSGYLVTAESEAVESALRRWVHALTTLRLGEQKIEGRLSWADGRAYFLPEDETDA